MTRPTSRVLALLEVLQAGGIHPVRELADRLGVDERTVRRYVSHLLDLEVPVLSVRGRYGGYRLGPGFRMPPLMLTDDEAAAVLLGLVAGRRAGLTVSGDDAADRATAKLRRVLPARLRGRLDALLETMAVTAPARRTVAPDSTTLLALADATRHQHPVAITYSSQDGRVGGRTLRPYGVVAHAGRWYVAAHDSVHEAVRVFRVDRITDLRALDGHFDAPPRFDPAAEVLRALASMPYRHRVALRIEGDAEDVRGRLPPALALVDPDEPAADGWARIRMRVDSLDWLPALLAGLDRPFVVDEPAELRDRVVAFAERLADYAAPPA